MRYMLDTNICSYVIKDRPASVRERLQTIPIDDIYISAITMAELHYGVNKSSSARVNQAVVDTFVQHVTVLTWDEDAAKQYGVLRALLENKGTPIGNMDLMIASHALAADVTLVTNNLKHFERVPDLKLENWV